MNDNIILIFPNGLFQENTVIEKALKKWKKIKIAVIEHPVFFTMYPYHKLKLILHRSSMKYYQDYLNDKHKSKVDITYYTFDNYQKAFKNKKNIMFHYHDPSDHFVINDLEKLAKKYQFKQCIYDTPMFLNTREELDTYWNQHKNKKIVHKQFYIHQRKKFKIMVDSKGNHIGKDWVFDDQNRKPFPKNVKKLKDSKLLSYVNKSKYVTEAKKYIEKNFSDNPGETDLYLPIEYSDVKKMFKQFMEKKLKCFGQYQDAVSKDITFGCHSIMSPLLNIGLITPRYIIDKFIKYIKSHKVAINNSEGYIRQLIGWREYTRMFYLYKHKELDSNYLNHTNKINKKIWYYGKGKTQFPMIDDMIQKVIKYGYLHHIERLMYVGNFLLITQTDPKDVFKWFQSMNIDSYHVFMYPNVYGMSQYSAKDIMMTRPYFSSANYINNMSDYKKNSKTIPKINLSGTKYKWGDVWDSIYYTFIKKHLKILEKNYSTAVQASHWKKKNKKDKKELVSINKKYFNTYI
jgi:deoxyribodipyrimidine photolyase-related protein